MKFSAVKGKTVLLRSGGVLGVVAGAYINKCTNVATHLAVARDGQSYILPIDNIRAFEDVEADALPTKSAETSDMSGFFYFEEGAEIRNEAGEVTDTARDLIITKSARAAKIVGDITTYGLSRITAADKSAVVLKPRAAQPLSARAEASADAPPAARRVASAFSAKICAEPQAPSADEIPPYFDNSQDEDAADEIPSYFDEISADDETRSISTAFDEPSGAQAVRTPIVYSNSFLRELVITDFTFLVGKRLFKDVFDLRGEFSVRTGEFVDLPLIDRARRYGKLVDLALSTK